MVLEDKLNRVSIVLMDIDGTMIRSESDSFGNIVRQLRRLKPAGIRFSVATGRTLHGSQRVLSDLRVVHMNMPPMIAYNGGVVAWPEDSTLIARNPIPHTILQELLDLVRSSPVVPLIYTCKDSWNSKPIETVYGESNLFYHPEKDFNGMTIRWVPDLFEIDRDDVTAVLLTPLSKDVDLHLVAEPIAAALGGQLRVTRSGNKYIEIAYLNTTKKHAMAILVKHYKLSLDDIMAIGDNYNDLEMIEAAGVGVAVANAPSEVKRAADYVCRHEASEGVVEIIRQLLASKSAHKRKSNFQMHKEIRDG